MKKIKFRITYFDRSWKVAAATNRLNLNMGSTSTEYEPLLLGQLNPTTRIPDLSSGVVEEFLEHKPVPVRWYPKLVAWESRLLWLLSGASIIVSIFNYMLIFATLTFTGHLGALELAGASIASVGIQGLAYGIMVVFLIPFISGILSPIKSLFLSSGFSFLQLGMASAVQTVCGQAYGAKQYAAMGIICQKATIIHMGAAVLLTFLYWFSGSFLKLIGQSVSIAEKGQTFARGMIPQLYAFALCCPTQRFLQAQNIVNPLAYMAIGIFLLHILLSWIVIYVLKFGLLGASLTLSFSWWLLALVQVFYIIFSPSCKETWTGFSLTALKDIWPYFKLTIASAVMLW